MAHRSSEHPAVWAVRPISSEPSATLERWRALEIRRKGTGDVLHVHLVGQLTERLEGRVSSAIRAVDPDQRRVTTSSGRAYLLVGAAGHSSEGEYVLENWLSVSQATVVRDVSHELFAATGVGGEAVSGGALPA